MVGLLAGWAFWRYALTVLVFVTLLITFLGAVGTWIQIVVQWRKDRKPEMEAKSGFVIPRRAAVGIVTALAVWTASSGYLAYRVLQPTAKSTVDPRTVIATFNSNSWGLFGDPANDRRAAFIDIIATNLGPQAGNYRVIGVTRIPDATSDINTDTRINRSSEFTIVEGVTRIEIPFSERDQHRLRDGGAIDILAIALPKEYSADEITSISKLQSFRGQILVHHAIGVPAEGIKR